MIFMGVYADEEWLLWFDSASGTPGVASTQQALESFNRRLKALAGSELNLDLYLGLIRLLPNWCCSRPYARPGAI